MSDLSIEANFEAKRRAGALACLDVMRQLVSEADATRCKRQSNREYVTCRFHSAADLLSQLPSMSSEVEGIAIALMEYIFYCEQTSGNPCLEESAWRPVVCMTRDEIDAEIAQYDEWELEDQNKSNVIPFPVKQ